MNILRNTRQRASVLVITVVFCGLIGVVLVAYLSMVSGQQKASHRSQVWNTCIPLCEAGVEEAMAHLNYSGTTSNFAINGWVLDAGAYRKQRTLNDGTIKMAINTGNPPVVTVNASLRSPIQSNWLTRSVQVQTKINQRFPYAVLGKGAINLNSMGARVDSFNSTNLLESTLGQYDPLKATDHAVVATVSKTPGNLDIGNVSIFGKVGTGPGGTVTVSSSGNVGDTLWNNNPLNDGKIEPGFYANDVNLYIPDVSLPSPFGPAFTPGPGIVGGTNYDLVIGSGDYKLASINVSGKILVTGKARLEVDGSSTIGNSGAIVIGAGASLEWYSAGNIDIQGVVNNPGYAKDFSIMGLNSCTDVKVNANATFVGTINAPYAAVTVTGNAHCSGAVVGASIKMTGGMQWHYDETLKGDPRKARFVAASWTEI